jgi:hypothetical protein
MEPFGSYCIELKIKNFEDNLDKFIQMYEGKFIQSYDGKFIFTQLKEFYKNDITPWMKAHSNDRTFYWMSAYYFNDIITAILEGDFLKAEDICKTAIIISADSLCNHVETDTTNEYTMKIQKNLCMYSRLRNRILVLLPYVIVEDEKEESLNPNIFSPFY